MKSACILSLAVLSPVVAAQPQKFDPARWEKTIAKFEQADRAAPPAKGGALFVGSSSIRLWKLNESFPDVKPINRGFGGSHVADSLHYVDRLVIAHEPRVVVMYAGDNDIAGGKTPKRVAADFDAFVAKVHAKLPKTKIAYIAVKPSIKRWNLAATMQQANAAIRARCEKNPRLAYIDIWTPMLGEDGKPQPNLFVEDGLHLNEKGYRLWTRLVKPHLRSAPRHSRR